MLAQIFGENASRQTSFTWKIPLSIVPSRFGFDTDPGLCHDSHQETARASSQSHSHFGAQITRSTRVGGSVDKEASTMSGKVVDVVVVVVEATVLVGIGIVVVVVGTATVVGATVSLVSRGADCASLVGEPEQAVTARATVVTKLNASFTASPGRCCHPRSRVASRAANIALIGVGVPDMGQHLLCGSAPQRHRHQLRSSRSS